MKKHFTKASAAVLMASVMAGSVFYAGDFAVNTDAAIEISKDDLNIGESEYNGTGAYDGLVALSGYSAASNDAAGADGSVDTLNETLVAQPDLESAENKAAAGDVAAATAVDDGAPLVEQPEAGGPEALTIADEEIASLMASNDAATLTLSGEQNADGALTVSGDGAYDVASIAGALPAEGEESVSANDVSAAAGAGIIAETVPEDMMDDPLDTDEGGNDYGYTILGVANVKDHLNVRKTADDDSELVGKMEGDAGCEILDIVGNKAHISSGSVEGYVSLDYLLTGNEAKAYADSHIKKVATVTADGLKVRYTPDTEGSVMALIGYNEDFEVVEENIEGGWTKILYDKKEGYVKSEYVKVGHKLKTALSMKELRKGQGVSDRRIALCEYAKQFLGNRYVWGGTSLTNGCDCSGYVLSLYAKYGVYLPHSSRAQATMGTKTTVAEAKPGDLVFYAKGGRINHVAMYIGGGQVIHASSPKLGIRITSVYYRTPVAVRRYFND